ncbi:MAG: protein kinase [Myxococcota bacterium]|nr:protein kinase [Myxococcota bacterium]
MHPCLTEAHLGALSRGELSSEEAARTQRHVDGCPRCYAQLLRGDRSDTDENDTRALEGPPNWKADAPPELNWQPGLDLGRYVILLTLGKGGMGVVFRAYDKELDRAVALKVLHQDEQEGGTPAASRLLREAQAMARLSHPNVVTVHDVVVLQRRVCVVMELVEGVNIREWLKTTPRRPWEQVVEVFRAAGEGLAAAHDAKLIHRDFKPDNVLVGQDGRARVTDFGIARLASEGGAGEPTPAGLPVSTPPGIQSPTTADSQSPAVGATPAASGGFSTVGAGTLGSSTLAGGTLMGASITREGQVVGTPRYMAPEQFDKRRADYRTDQFSFGLALYEALYGQHAFAGARASQWLEHAKRGEVRPPPAGSQVPPWIHRILLRALAADPEARFASMRELTKALGHDPSQRRNRVLVGVGVATALGLALVTAVQVTRARAQLCSGSEDRLVGVWDTARREAVHAAFAATGLPFAEDSFSRAAQVLDGYTRQWVAVHQDSCEATRVRGEQSDQLLTLRMACLEQRRKAVSAATELFARADPVTVGKAKQLLDDLPRLDTCSDLAALTARLPPPEDPAVATEVERVRSELTRANLLAVAGRVEESGGVARAALTAAEKTGYSPVVAEAEAALGVVQYQEGDHDGAKRRYISAFTRALGDGHDEVSGFAAVRVAANVLRLHQNKEALQWAGFAEAANRRAQDPNTAVLVNNSRGNILRNEGDFVQAAEYYRRAMEEAKERLGPEHMTTLGTSYNHASALQNLGRFGEAQGKYAAVVEITRRVLGPKHPFLAYALVGSALVAGYRGEVEQSRAFYEEVLGISGDRGPNAANAHEGLSKLAVEQRRFDDARTHLAAALQLTEATLPGGPESLGILAQQGRLRLQEGKLDLAWKRFGEVLDSGAKMSGTFDPVSDAQRGKAQILLLRKQPAKALPLAESAVTTLISTRGKSHPVTLESRLVVAEARWDLGQRDQARALAAQVLTEARVELPPTHPVCVQAKALAEGDRAE